MARANNDPLRRWETAFLFLGAAASASLLAWNAREAWLAVQDTPFQAIGHGIYGAKLLLLEAALVAPFIVLSLLSDALVRETHRARYRVAGLTISVAAGVGVFAMLLRSMPEHRAGAIDHLMASVVPALLFLSVCAGLYGALVWLAQHGRLDHFMDGGASGSSPRGHE